MRAALRTCERYLYMFTFPNGKQYIGVTMCLASRFKSHRVEALTWKRYAVHRAIAKYGWEKVKYTILCIGSFEYIKDLEVKAIARYNTVAPHGYNLTLGGDGTKGLQLSKEVRAAIRARMIGNDYTKGNSYTEEEKRLWKKWKHSEETKRKMSVSQTGKVVSSETRKKQSEIAKQRTFSLATRAAMRHGQLGRKMSAVATAKRVERYKKTVAARRLDPLRYKQIQATMRRVRSQKLKS